MKTRVELMTIACMTSAEVVGVLCTFELPSRNTPRPKTYLYKCPRELAETLRPGDLVMAEYDVQQASNRDRPLTPVLVYQVQEDFDPEEMTMVYRWIFDRVNLDRLKALKAWENETTNALVSSQRRRAQEAVLREVAGDLVNRPSFPKLATPARAGSAQNTPTEDALDEVIEPPQPSFQSALDEVIEPPQPSFQSARAMRAAHEAPDNGYQDLPSDHPSASDFFTKD